MNYHHHRHNHLTITYTETEISSTARQQQLCSYTSMAHVLAGAISTSKYSLTNRHQSPNGPTVVTKAKPAKPMRTVQKVHTAAVTNNELKEDTTERTHMQSKTALGTGKICIKKQ